MKPATAILALVAILVLAACGGDDEPETEATATQSGPCSEIEELDVLSFGEHEQREFTVADYETNPPAGGDHNPRWLRESVHYTDPQPLGEAVHLLEHGAVIGWTNNLAAADREAVEEEFDAILRDGYYQLATVELPDLEVPFALSAWGALQTCEEVETSAIRPFVEQWYASPKSGESALACQGRARGLPPC